MRISYPRVFPLTLLIVLGLLVWWLSETSSLGVSLPKADAGVPDLTAVNVVGTRFDRAGKPTDKLTSVELRHYQQDNVTWLTSPVLVHTTENNPKLTVSSLRAKVLQDTDEIYLYENVKLVRDAATDRPVVTIDTSSVLVNVNDETARSDAPVSAVMGKSHATAVGFDFDNRNEVLNLHHEVKVTYVREK